MNEEAKAVQEIAKTTSKAIDATEKLGNFLSKILGDGFIDLGLAFSDWANVYRYENSLKLYDKVEQIHINRKIQGKLSPILPKYAFPILQKASLEDDDGIQTLWAGLIANATDPNENFQIKKLYIEILSSLDPIDASMLSYLDKSIIAEEYNFINGKKLNAEELAKLLKMNEDDIKLSLSNLIRNGLIDRSGKLTIDTIDLGNITNQVDNPEVEFRISYLGRKLMNGCKVK